MNSEHTGCQYFIRAINDSTFTVGCLAHRWVELAGTRTEAQSLQARHAQQSMNRRISQGVARQSDDVRPSRAENFCPVCKIIVPKGGHYHMASEVLGA